MQRNATTRRPRKLARLLRSLQAAGITQRAVAVEAGVVPPVVCHVFAGRAVSANVITAAQRLLAGRDARV